MGLAESVTGFLSSALNFFIALVRALLLLGLGLLLIVVVLAAIFANSARLTLLDSNFYLAQLDSANAYDSAKAVAIQTVVSSATGSLPDSSAKTQLESKMSSSLSEAVPTAWLRNNTRKILANSFAYAKGETYSLDLRVPIAELKPGLTTAAKEILPLFIQAQTAAPAASSGSSGKPQPSGSTGPFTWPGNCNNLPDCISYCKADHPECRLLDGTPFDTRIDLELIQYHSSCSNFDDCVGYCHDLGRQSSVAEVVGNCTRLVNFVDATAPGKPIPPEVLARLKSANISAVASAVQSSPQLDSAMQENALSAIQQQVDALPDTADLDGLTGNQLSAALSQLRQPVGMAYTACNALIVVALVLCGLIALVAFSIKGALRHIGWPLGLAGLISLLISFFAPKMILDTAAQGVAAVPSQATGVLMDLASRIVGGYFNQVLVFAAIVFLLGVVMFAVSFKIADKSAASSQSPQPAKAQAEPTAQATAVEEKKAASKPQAKGPRQKPSK